MNELQRKYGPWAVTPPGGARPGHDYCIICTVDDRLPKIKESFDLEWLRAVAADQDGGKTVRLAAERRLTFLRKLKNKTNDV